MIVLALDPATCSAYTIFDTAIVGDTKSKIIKYGLIDLSGAHKFDNDGQKLAEFEKHVISLIKNNSIEQVALEDYFFNSRFRSGSSLNGAVRAIVWLVCAKLNIPYHIINISKWKTHIAGNVKPEKVLVKKLTKKVASKEYIKLALERKYQIILGEQIYDLAKNCMVPFKYDISDSIGIGIYFIEAYQQDVLKKVNREKEASEYIAAKIAKEKAVEKSKKEEQKAIEKARRDEQKAIEKARRDEEKAIEKARRDKEKSIEKQKKDEIKAIEKAAKKIEKKQTI